MDLVSREVEMCRCGNRESQCGWGPMVKGQVRDIRADYSTGQRQLEGETGVPPSNAWNFHLIGDKK